MLVALLLVAAASDVNVASQLQAGKVLCSNPDPVTKTCSAIASYSTGPNGNLVETSEILLSPNQPITLEVSAGAEIGDSTICGTLELADLQNGKVRVNGTPLPPDRNAAALEKIMVAMKPMAGRKTCDALVLDNGQLLKFGQVDGMDMKLPGKPVAWISPADGYRVGPR